MARGDDPVHRPPPRALPGGAKRSRGPRMAPLRIRAATGCRQGLIRRGALEPRDELRDVDVDRGAAAGHARLAPRLGEAGQPAPLLLASRRPAVAVAGRDDRDPDL